jgi:hypothetical protein
MIYSAGMEHIARRHGDRMRFVPGGIMKRNRVLFGVIVLFVLLFAGCSLFPDVIEGSWQQVSVNGVNSVLVTVVAFTGSAYTCSVAGITTNTGTWTRSGSQYTLNGSFFGFVATSVSFTPVFSRSNNTLSYTDSNGYVEVYNRQ